MLRALKSKLVALPSSTFTALAASNSHARDKVLDYKLEDAQQQRAKEAEMMTRIIESTRIAGEQQVVCGVRCMMRDA
jgi:hypothetical protein